MLSYFSPFRLRSKPAPKPVKQEFEDEDEVFADEQSGERPEQKASPVPQFELHGQSMGQTGSSRDVSRWTGFPSGESSHELTLRNCNSARANSATITDTVHSELVPQPWSDHLVLNAQSSWIHDERNTSLVRAV